MKNRADWSTEELVHHILSNEHDEEAFRVLYDRYELSLFKMVASKIDNRSDAEEIVQDTLYRAFEHLNELEDAKKFYAWLRKIAHQLIVDWYRREDQKIETVSINTVSERKLYAAAVTEARLDEQNAIDRAQLERIRDLIDKLPKRQREALLLWCKGLSCEEVADELGTSVAGVHKLLYRARKRLREKFRVDPFLDE